MIISLKTRKLSTEPFGNMIVSLSFMFYDHHTCLRIPRIATDLIIPMRTNKILQINAAVFWIRKTKPFCRRPFILRVQTDIFINSRTHRNKIILVSGIAAGCSNIKQLPLQCVKKIAKNTLHKISQKPSSGTCGRSRIRLFSERTSTTQIKIHNMVSAINFFSTQANTSVCFIQVCILITSLNSKSSLRALTYTIPIFSSSSPNKPLIQSPAFTGTVLSVCHGKTRIQRLIRVRSSCILKENPFIRFCIV